MDAERLSVDFSEIMQHHVRLPASVPSWRKVRGVSFVPVTRTRRGDLETVLCRENDGPYEGLLNYAGGKVNATSCCFQTRSAYSSPDKHRDNYRETSCKKAVLRQLFHETFEELRVVLPISIQTVKAFMGIVTVPIPRSKTGTVSLIFVFRARIFGDVTFQKILLRENEYYKNHIDPANYHPPLHFREIQALHKVSINRTRRTRQHSSHLSAYVASSIDEVETLARSNYDEPPETNMISRSQTSFSRDLSGNAVIIRPTWVRPAAADNENDKKKKPNHLKMTKVPVWAAFSYTRS